MGLFTPADYSDDLSYRQEGFGRYKQLMSFYSLPWMKVNLLTIVGALPLTAGVALSILTSSIAVLLPLSIMGGMIFGPFLAGMYDSILRGLRDAPGSWWEHYKKSWKQNWKASLLPGGVTGLFVGLLAFMLYMMDVAVTAASAGTIAMLYASMGVFLGISTVYWPQLVLFDQSNLARLKNVLLFTLKHSTRVLGAVVLQLLYGTILYLFAPLTLILIPFLGFWFILMVAQFRIYEPLDYELHIEERFIPIEGDPWAKDRFDSDDEDDEDEEEY